MAKTVKQAIDMAVKRAGGQSELARLIGIKPQSVQAWVTNGEIPPKRVIQVEEVTGVSRHDLAPSIYPRPVA